MVYVIIKWKKMTKNVLYLINILHCSGSAPSVSQADAQQETKEEAHREENPDDVWSFEKQTKKYFGCLKMC